MWKRIRQKIDEWMIDKEETGKMERINGIDKI